MIHHYIDMMQECYGNRWDQAISSGCLHLTNSTQLMTDGIQVRDTWVRRWSQSQGEPISKGGKEHLAKHHVVYTILCFTITNVFPALLGNTW